MKETPNLVRIFVGDMTQPESTDNFISEPMTKAEAIKWISSYLPGMVGDALDRYHLVPVDENNSDERKT